MKEEHKASNDAIRKMVADTKGEIQDGKFTNMEMGELLRGKSQEEVLAARPKRERSLTAAQIQSIMEIMTNNPGTTWTKAKNQVIQALDDQEANSTSAKMNALIRQGRGTVVVADDGKEADNGKE